MGRPGKGEGLNRITVSQKLYLFRQHAAAIGWRNVRIQEVGDTFVGINLIFHPRKSMAFVFVDFQLNYPAALLDGIDHLLGFLLGAARILSAGKKQQWRFNLVHEKYW